MAEPEDGSLLGPVSWPLYTHTQQCLDLMDELVQTFASTATTFQSDANLTTTV